MSEALERVIAEQQKEIDDLRKHNSAAIGAILAGATMNKFPRQPNGEGGWTICPKFLGSLIRSMEESDFRPCMEEAEQVLLALERLNEVVHDRQPHFLRVNDGQD